SEPELKFYNEFEKTDLLAMEKETTGLYLSGHPMAAYALKSNELKCTQISEINKDSSSIINHKDGEQVKVMGIISSVKRKVTKSDTTMAFMQIEDITGQIETVVFPKTLLENQHIIEEGKIVVVNGRLDIRDDEPSVVVCDKIMTPQDAEIQTPSNNKSAEKKHKRNGLFLKFKSKNCSEQIQAEKFLDIFDGYTPLYYYFEDTKEYRLVPREKFITPNKPLLDELENILGRGNVVLR
ncbi:MAG: DNA polymerase III subunit alpha, partial [Ruminococcus sp.]|nr:DNA polymerase III subunit alpha [Candidatus Copronaster equi]